MSQRVANTLPHLILHKLESLTDFDDSLVRTLIKTLIVEYVSVEYTKAEKIGKRSIFYRGGTTAIISIQLFNFNKLIIINIGDSKGLWLRGGKMQETVNHDKTNAVEVKRLGRSLVRGRIAGMLAVTRSIGDLNVENKATLKYGKRKTRYVSHNPDIYISNLEGKYVVLMSDGIEEAMIYGNYRHYKKTMIDIY